MKVKPTPSPIFPKNPQIPPNPWMEKERGRMRSHTARVGRKRITELESRRVPVLMRGTISGLPMATPRRTYRANKRLDVSIGVPGAEIRLPSLPQVQVGWRLLSALLSLSLLALVYLLWTAPLFLVRTATIQGLQRISAKEVLIELDLQDQPIFTIDPDEIRQTISTQFPEFRSVEVKLQFPNKVNIQVDERKPLLVWKQGERTLLVDAEGFAFPVRGEGNQLPKLVVEAQDAPFLSDSEIPNQLQEPILPVDLVSGILSISAMIPDGAVMFYDSERGLGWRDPRGWAVYVGALKDIGLKMKIYELMVKKLKKQDIKPAIISIEYVHAPYYRLER